MLPPVPMKTSSHTSASRPRPSSGGKMFSQINEKSHGARAGGAAAACAAGEVVVGCVMSLQAGAKGAPASLVLVGSLRAAVAASSALWKTALTMA
jgi:hypothetical protein